MTENQTSPAPQGIICRASRDPYVRLAIVALLLIALGGYTIYDHYILGNYPKPESYDLNKYIKYMFNHYIPYLLIPAGLILLFIVVAGIRRVLEADQEGIGYKGKSKTPWNSIKRVDPKLLKTKGILDLYDEMGRKIRLDSWYLTNFRELVAFVEQHIPPEAMKNK